MKLTIEKVTELAINAAKESKEKHKIGAVLFCGNKYVSSYNKTFSVIVTDRKTPYSSHAEASVIDHGLHLGFDLSKCSLVVVRVGKQGNLLLAKPCKVCTNMIQKYKIPRIFYSNDPFKRLLISKNFKSL